MKDIDTPEHDNLRRFPKLERQRQEWTQQDLARRMGRRQGFVCGVESGQHCVSDVAFLQFDEALGFDPCKALRRVKSKRQASAGANRLRSHRAEQGAAKVV